ncbi:MAG: class I SAM-dependent methyltransferase [candidate division FCPU426 bacterium]
MAWFARLLAEAGIRRGRLLDLGCGRGRNSLPFIRRGWRVTGMDPVSGALAAFERLARTHRSRLTLHCGSFAGPLPWSDGAFDAVMEITAADNLANRRRQQRLWRECARVLKPGGLLLSYHFTRRDGYYGLLLRKSGRRKQGILFDRRAGMGFRFYTAGDIAAAARGRLQRLETRSYRYPGPMFGRRYVRDLKAAVFRKRLRTGR